ncbi:GntR family transcriptional regulator [Microbacterium resistens]|uniref:GntR family transcriptional regulator n=1 Tax=Microbacterium resistens TaxID=156977 RepID=A0ABU1S8I2_9MICO|nr:GntR family transcriptional regulator [Microbacterium resistens]MDR6865917.1 GntR family transcriptional regulator [Microbacterium resistens]
MTNQRRIAGDLSRRIIDGEFALGGTLPSEQELVAHYGHARGTVRGALALLSAQGMIVPRQGSGWLISATVQQQSFTRLRSFAQWARSRGLRPDGRVVASRRAKATPAQARAFRLGTAEEVLHIVRVRSLDGREIMLERTVYAPWLIGPIESLDAGEPSVVQALEERWGIVTAHAEHGIDAVAASSEDARLLPIRRTSPLLRVRRASFAKDGRPMELGDDRYLPGTIAFQVQSSLASSPLSRTLS